MKRASYKEGVAWIAENDGPGNEHANRPNEVANLISVALLADLFDKDRVTIGEEIVAYRVKHGIVTERWRPAKPSFSMDFSADDFVEGSDDYFEQLCIDHKGSAVRDNTRAERIAIVKDIEENGIDG